MSEIRKSAEQVDAEAISDEDFAAYIDMDLGGDQNDNNSSENLPSREDMWTVIQSQQEIIENLEVRVEELENAQEENDEKKVEMAQAANMAADEASEAAEEAEKARTIAQNAHEKVNEALDDSDEKVDSGGLPGDLEPSSSPLDFFANCRPRNVKQLFIDDQGKKNRWRALNVAQRWPEFATRSNDGKTIIFTRTDLKNALTAIQGERPHGTTVTRVWEILRDDLGGSDLKETTIVINAARKDGRKTVLKMDRGTAEGLHDGRYGHLNLLDTGGEMALGGGVTPVVTGDESAEV